MSEPSPQDRTNLTINNYIGNNPDISEDMEVQNRTISDVAQAILVCETMVNDWKKGIVNSARITAKLNGERPYNQKKLENAAKGWKTNLSTGFLATECRKVAPRLYMPLKTAKYLTASTLPEGWPDGEKKTGIYRQAITETIRSWPKFNFYIRGMAREVSHFGFAFNVFLDQYEWRSSLLRMDRGFVPQGTEVMETEPPFFMAKWDYKPHELLKLLKDNVDAGRDEWKKDNVIKAINNAVPPPVDATYPQARSYQELVRQATWTFTYARGAKLIHAWHLFAKEATGKVSHYIMLGTQTGTVALNQISPTVHNESLLYEYLDQYDSMEDAVNAMVFDFGDGTIHGVWGAGQILYDLAAQVEKIRCDSIDNMRMTNKMKLQVPDAKNVNDVRLNVTSDMMIVSGAQFAGNTAALPGDISGYELLDQKLSQIAREKIGSYIPPIPLQPSDIKAAQINAKVSDEKELQEDMLECWLIQIAIWVKNISKRLLLPDSPDETAKKLRAKLLEKLTEEELAILVESTTSQSIAAYTEYAAQQRGLFAHSVLGNPLFRQSSLARVMAEGAGDERFVQSICLPEGDQTEQMRAQRDQLIENASLALGQPTPVLPDDNDWVHMQTLQPGLMAALQAGQVQMAQAGLQHYTAHWSSGVNKKTLPIDQINPSKQFIAAAEKTIAALQQKQQVAQAHQQAGVTPASQTPEGQAQLAAPPSESLGAPAGAAQQMM